MGIGAIRFVAFLVPLLFLILRDTKAGDDSSDVLWPINGTYTALIISSYIFNRDNLNGVVYFGIVCLITGIVLLMVGSDDYPLQRRLRQLTPPLF